MRTAIRASRLSLVCLAIALSVACASVAPGNDPVVVRAEQTWRIGFDTVDSFVILERQGTVPGLKGSAAAHSFAEKLRAPNPEGAKFSNKDQVVPYGRWIFNKLDAAIQTYKANRTPENKATIETYLALAENLIASAQQFMKGGAA